MAFRFPHFNSVINGIISLRQGLEFGWGLMIFPVFPMAISSSVEPPIQIALALLRSPSFESPMFLMQLRDDIPEIPCPGQWGLFGGHLDPGETADECIHRELEEEIGRDVPQLELYRVVEEARLIRHMYHGVLTVPVEELVLGEGMDLKLVSLTELDVGQAWSAAIAETRSMGEFHRGILLEFWHALSQGRLDQSLMT